MLRCIWRLVTGESMFINDFTAEHGPGEIGIAPGAPGDLRHQHLNNETQHIVNEAYKKLSKKHNIPLIISNDVHYVKKEDADEFEGHCGIFTGKTSIIIPYKYIPERERLFESCIKNLKSILDMKDWISTIEIT